jgi:hypothetical protein
VASVVDEYCCQFWVHIAGLPGGRLRGLATGGRCTGASTQYHLDCDGATAANGMCRTVRAPSTWSQKTAHKSGIRLSRLGKAPLSLVSRLRGSCVRWTSSSWPDIMYSDKALRENLQSLLLYQPRDGVSLRLPSSPDPSRAPILARMVSISFPDHGHPTSYQPRLRSP